jgi:hypothetical protein
VTLGDGLQISAGVLNAEQKKLLVDLLHARATVKKAEAELEEMLANEISTGVYTQSGAFSAKVVDRLHNDEQTAEVRLRESLTHTAFTSA